MVREKPKSLTMHSTNVHLCYCYKRTALTLFLEHNFGNVQIHHPCYILDHVVMVQFELSFLVWIKNEDTSELVPKMDLIVFYALPPRTWFDCYGGHLYDGLIFILFGL